MANKIKPFSATDFKNATNVKKQYCSFQYIEGQLPRNSMKASGQFAMRYLMAIMSNLLADATIEGDPEAIMDDIKKTVLEDYKILKEGRKPKES